MSLDRNDATQIPVNDAPADDAAPADPASTSDTTAPATDEKAATPTPADPAPATDSAPAPASTQPSTASDTAKEVDIDGYKLKVDYDVVDDVDNLELINKIEQGGYLYGIIEFLQKIVGKDEYDKLKAYFVEKEGKLSLTKLGEIYQKIFEQFDPKG